MTIMCGAYPVDITKDQAERILKLAVEIDGLPIPEQLQAGLETSGEGRYKTYWIKQAKSGYRRPIRDLWARMSVRAKLLFHMAMLNSGLAYTREIVKQMDITTGGDGGFCDEGPDFNRVRETPITDPVVLKVLGHLSEVSEDLLEVVEELCNVTDVLVDEVLLPSLRQNDATAT